MSEGYRYKTEAKNEIQIKYLEGEERGDKENFGNDYMLINELQLRQSKPWRRKPTRIKLDDEISMR